MPAYSHVLEEQEHLSSADLDSCPDCNDTMVTRGDDKVCAGCGTRQPVIVTTAKHDWAFVAKMAMAANEFHRRKAMDFQDPAFTPGTDAFAIEQYANELGPDWNPTDSEPGEWLEMTNLKTGEKVHITPDGVEDADSRYAKRKKAAGDPLELIKATANELVRAWDEISANQEGDIPLTLKYYDQVALDILGDAAEKAGITSTNVEGDDEERDRQFQQFEEQVYAEVFKIAPEIKAAMYEDAMPSTRQDYQRRAMEEDPAFTPGPAPTITDRYESEYGEQATITYEFDDGTVAHLFPEISYLAVGSPDGQRQEYNTDELMGTGHNDPYVQAILGQEGR